MYLKKKLKKNFMDGVQLPQGYSHFEEAVFYTTNSFAKKLTTVKNLEEKVFC